MTEDRLTDAELDRLATTLPDEELHRLETGRSDLPWWRPSMVVRSMAGEILRLRRELRELREPPFEPDPAVVVMIEEGCPNVD